MRARRARAHHHSVYVVELSSEVLNEPRFRRANQDYRLGFPCVYVGMTGLSPEVYESMKKQTPLGYVAEPEEVAGPVVFLASDHAKYITGSTINVSGGFLMY